MILIKHQPWEMMVNPRGYRSSTWLCRYTTGKEPQKLKVVWKHDTDATWWAAWQRQSPLPLRLQQEEQRPLCLIIITHGRCSIIVTQSTCQLLFYSSYTHSFCLHCTLFITRYITLLLLLLYIHYTTKPLQHSYARHSTINCGPCFLNTRRRIDV